MLEVLYHRAKFGGARISEPPNVKLYPKLWFLATGSRHNEHVHMKLGV